MDERRRNMDADYVTRREWDMHVLASTSRDSRLEAHMKRQDDAIDKLEANIGRLLGGIAVLVVIGNVIVGILGLVGGS